MLMSRVCWSVYRKLSIQKTMTFFCRKQKYVEYELYAWVCNINLDLIFWFFDFFRISNIDFLKFTDSNACSSLWFNETVERHELDEIIEKLRNLKCNSDDDKIHPKMVIMSGNSFRTCLINLFNSCLRSGPWPWTDTRVLFIKKPMKADYSNPSAYRPISISSHIGKVFERISNRRLMRYMLSEKPIDIEQEGFLPKKNTVRLLFRLKLECERLKKSKLCAASINLDLEKAFDSVWHNGLLLKLWTAGIRGSLFFLLRNFLKCRLIRIKLDGVLSSPIKPKKGVPQGRVLSPLLFIFFIAEMLKKTDGTKFKYADDICRNTSLSLRKNSEKPEFGENMVEHMANSNERIENRDNAHSPTGYLGPQVSSGNREMWSQIPNENSRLDRGQRMFI